MMARRFACYKKLLTNEHKRAEAKTLYKADAALGAREQRLVWRRIDAAERIVVVVVSVVKLVQLILPRRNVVLTSVVVCALDSKRIGAAALVDEHRNTRRCRRAAQITDGSETRALLANNRVHALVGGARMFVNFELKIFVEENLQRP